MYDFEREQLWERGKAAFAAYKAYFAEHPNPKKGTPEWDRLRHLADEATRLGQEGNAALGEALDELTIDPPDD